MATPERSGSIPSEKRGALSLPSLLNIYVFLFIAFNIVLLWIKRDYFVSGWGLLGFAEGSWTLFHKDLVESVLEFWSNSRSYQYWNTENSVIFPVVSGILHNWKPWPFWLQLFNLLLFFSVTFWCASSLKAEKRLFYAALGASPVLLSFSIVAFPCISCVIPYAFALVILFRFESGEQAKRMSIVLELIGWVFVYELSFHCYEPGKTVAVLPFLAALSLPGIRISRRILWLVMGGLMIYGLFFHYGSTAEPRLIQLMERYGSFPSAAQVVLKGFFIEWYSDLPFLFIAGIISCFLIRENRWFWRLLIVGHILLLLMEATQRGFYHEVGLRPRRFILMDFLSALVCAKAWCDLKSTKTKAALILVICAGQAFTLRSTLVFLTNPPERRALPYIHSPADFKIDRRLIRDAKRLSELAHTLNTVHFLSYGYSKYAENTTDPAALPERVLLHLGPEEYTEKIFFIDHKRRGRYTQFPMHSHDAFVEKAASLKGECYLHVYRKKVYSPMLIYGHKDFESFTWRYLNRSKFTPVDFGFEYFDSYRIEEFDRPGPVRIPELQGETEGYADAVPQGALCHSRFDYRWVWRLLKEMSKKPYEAPAAQIKVPFEIKVTSAMGFYFEGIYVNRSEEPIPVTIRAAADDGLVVLINGQTVAHYYSEVWPPPDLTSSVVLAKGVNRLQIFFTNCSSAGRIEFSSVTEDGSEVPWTCPSPNIGASLF